jgi:hypothetical protein
MALLIDLSGLTLAPLRDDRDARFLGGIFVCLTDGLHRYLENVPRSQNRESRETSAVLWLEIQI